MLATQTRGLPENEELELALALSVIDLTEDVRTPSAAIHRQMHGTLWSSMSAEEQELQLALVQILTEGGRHAGTRADDGGSSSSTSVFAGSAASTSLPERVELRRLATIRSSEEEELQLAMAISAADPIVYSVPPAARTEVSLATIRGSEEEELLLAMAISADDPIGYSVPPADRTEVSHVTSVLRFEPSAADHAEECAVCLENFQRDTNLRILPCLHRFHESCADRWFAETRTCPVCKNDICAGTNF